ncbi:hypothetical protein [Streptomyces albireticuli]|uniref:HNH endonuclease n=1 Tax=Streptomyces albireticuli TaxID=1940 RepID=A0A2A2DFI8_9ACTN|nr:hypothetical protein [Streptomyces albireticuli]MCD9145758.1 hypothetical protein [Streptomyces albireticuli]MCD9165835.1 hypothetical protein [Streptomyces albireticuli]PAU50295.1 hypothetical protein CK936_03355 [Streptomyces albireticuli]
MSRTAYVYVPSPSRENLAIGLRHNLWGWRPSALDRAGAREDVKRLTEGDFLVLGHRGPNSRVKPGGWSQATLKRVIVAQVTEPHFVDHNEVWPDDSYPERLRISVLSEEEEIPGDALGAEAMECLRLSANKQGAAVLVSGVGAVAELATRLPEAGPSGPDGVIDHSGELSTFAKVLVRREQQKLRRKKFGSDPAQLTCAFCQRVLPPRMVRAAHIKRRSVATREEQLNLSNITAACLIGCDELFEHGYIFVNDAGVIETAAQAAVTADLKKAATSIAGRTMQDFSETSAPFFAWHRKHIAH